MMTHRASATARAVAAATVMREHGRPTGGAPPAGAAAWCERFLSTTRTDRVLLQSVRSTLGHGWWRLVEWVTLPGIVSHWMRRKREIDRLAHQAADDGYTQLIVIGAGLDALAFRLSAERLYQRVIVADHPATLAVVRAAVGSATHGVELVALELLCQDAHAVLTGSATFDPTRATLIVIEGVLMYLPQRVVEQVLHSLATLPSPRTRLIASWMLAQPEKPIGFRDQSRLIGSWLQRRGEPMLWASTPAALPSMLSKLGWNNTRLINLTVGDSSARSNVRGLPDEQLVIADNLNSQAPAPRPLPCRPNRPNCHGIFPFSSP